MSRVEEFDLEAASEAEFQPRRQRSSRSTWQAPAPWMLVAAVLVLLGVLAAEPAQPQWQQGIVAHIGTPGEQWFIAGESDHGDQVWTGRESVLVVSDRQVRGMSVTTGQPLWQIDGRALRCSQPVPDGLAACVSGAPQSAELIMIDPSHGEASRTPWPGLLAATPYDGDLLTVHRHQEEALLQLEDGDGQVRWSVPLGRALNPLPGRGTILAVAGDHILLSMRTSETEYPLWAVHRVSDGELIEELSSLMVAPAPAVRTDPWMLIDPQGFDVRYLTTTGAVSPVQPAVGVPLGVDDDLTAGVRVRHMDGAVHGESEPDAAPIWSDTTGDVVRLLGRVQGHVLVHRGTHASALDEQTGRVQWHEPVPYLQGQLLTDGRTLLGVNSVDGPLTLHGIDVTTGAHVLAVRAQSAPAHATVVDVQAYGTNLAILTDHGLSMWSLD